MVCGCVPWDIRMGPRGTLCAALPVDGAMRRVAVVKGTYAYFDTGSVRVESPRVPLTI